MSREFKEGGSRTLKSFGSEEIWKSYFLTALNYGELSSAFMQLVIDRAISSHDYVNEGDFLRSINSIAKELFGGRRKYVAVFPVWNVSPYIEGVMRRNGVTMNFSPARTEKWTKVVQNRQELAKDQFFKGLRIFPSETADVSLVFCSVTAVSPQDAYLQADTVLATELGILSALATSPHSYRLSFGEKKPISKFLVCPMVTVHSEKGELAYKGFWYSSFPRNSDPERRVREEGDKLSFAFKRLRGEISKSALKSESEDFLARFQKAFSQTDMEDVFMDGWRLMEKMCSGNDRKTSYDDVVRRAASHWMQSDMIIQIGMHLKDRRNYLSHGRDIAAEDQEDLAFQVLKLLHPILMGISWNRFGFRSLSEYHEFCDAPRNLDDLRRRMFIIDKAISYISK